MRLVRSRSVSGQSLVAVTPVILVRTRDQGPATAQSSESTLSADTATQEINTILCRSMKDGFE